MIGFAGEQRFVDIDAAIGQQRAIDYDLVAGANQHGVTGHNGGWIDGPFLSVADDRRARAGEQGDTVKLALGANFLEDT